MISWSVFLEVRQEGWKWKIYLFVTYQIYTSMNMFNLRTGKLVQVLVHWSDHKNMTVKFLVVGTESWNSIVIIKLQVFGVNSISFLFFWKENKNKLYIALFCFSDALYYNGDGGFAENCVSQTVDHLKPITFSDVPLTYTPYM